MALENNIGEISTQISKTIDDLNNVFFEVVKDIYSSNFINARIVFFGSGELIDSVLKYSKIHNQYYEYKTYLDTSKANELLNSIVSDFEKKDYQDVSDLLLYDFSSLLNEYNEELKKCL